MNKTDQIPSGTNIQGVAYTGEAAEAMYINIYTVLCRQLTCDKTNLHAIGNKVQVEASEATADLSGELPDESCIHLQWQLPPEVKLRAEGLGLEGGLKRRNGQL